MIYLYDRIVGPTEISFKRFGVEYKLEKTFRMGQQYYYSFQAPNREKILVIPLFYEQYLEVLDKSKKIARYKRFETCLRKIEEQISEEITVDMFESDEGQGEMPVVVVLYKDIKVTYEFRTSGLILLPEFTIVKNNIFGNNLFISFEDRFS